MKNITVMIETTKLSELNKHEFDIIENLLINIKYHAKHQEPFMLNEEEYLTFLKQVEAFTKRTGLLIVVTAQKVEGTNILMERVIFDSDYVYSRGIL